MEIRNLKYNEFGTIDCEINHPEHGWIPFTADPDDCEEHGRQIHQQATAGDFGPIADFVPPPPPTEEELAAMVRAERDQLIRDTDWSQLPDVPSDIQTKYKQYRQALRDIPEQEGFPKDVTWPKHPEG